MKRVITLFCTLFVLYPASIHAQAIGDVARIRGRLLASLVPPLARQKSTVAAAEAHLKTLREDGSWPDIDYTVTDREHWTPEAHLSRLHTMAQAYRCPGDLLARDALRRKISAAFDFWCKADPHCTNWWHNEIGAPSTVGEILILMGDDLSREQIARGVEILQRARWKKWTGQNLVWGVTIQILRGCVENSPQVVREAYDRMYQEIRVAGPGEEGIQADMSFHQHGPLLYSGGYGMGFSTDTVQFIELADGTAFAPPAGKLRLVESYLLDGQQWMVIGKTFDYGAVGRELTRRGKSAAALLEPVAALARVAGPRQSEFAQFAARLRGDTIATALVGNRHFWLSDYMSHRRPHWMASARMFSTRTLNTDGFINGENRQSHHLADGMNLLYRSGDEYRDIFPVWDWHRIPGTTAIQGTQLEPRKVSFKGRTRFVGGVSDGTYGMAAMDLDREGLTAHKAWFFFDDQYVCLGAGIQCAADKPVYTSVNQCWLKGPIEKGKGWVWHDSVAYLFPANPALQVEGREQKGSWSAIGTGPAAPLSQPVFSLWLDHGMHPTEASYAYVVIPGVDSATAANRAAHPDVAVVSNTPQLQAVAHGELRMVQIAFWRAGRVDAGFVQIEVDQPCLLLAKVRASSVTLAVSNPENAALAVNVRASASGVQTSTRLELPGGLEAGRSVVKVVK